MILDGRTVIDTAGPSAQMCGRLFADLGALVVKVEPPGGDPVRQREPLAGEARVSLPYVFWNGGKRSVVLDAGSAAGRERLRRLIGSADLWLDSDDSALPAVAREQPARTTPKVHVSGFGSGGPYEDFLAPDLVLTAMGGLTYISGDADRPPCSPPEYQAYYASSFTAFSAGVETLWRAASGRVVGDVEVCAREVIASFDQMVRTWGFDGKRIRRDGSQHSRVAPAAVFATADGYVHLFVSTKHWPLFLAAWPAHPPVLDDDEWRSNDVRRRRASWLNEEVRRFVASYDTRSFVAAMEEAGVPCLPVNGPADVRGDPHMVERGVFAENTYRGLGAFAEPRPPITVDGSCLAVTPAPEVGEGEVDVLRALGQGGLRPPGRGRAGSRGGESVPGGLPEPGGATSPTLEGVRVISFTAGVAGPRTGRALAEMGAEVLKVESRAGGLDPFRYFRRRDAEGDDGFAFDASTRFAEVNLGVRSVTLDLRRPVGRDLALELVARSDVVLDNFRPGVLERLGLGPRDLRRANPRVVILRAPGMGSVGPKSGFGTWGPSLMAFSGLTHLWNHPGASQPVGSQSVYPDYLVSCLAPGMAVAGLLQLARTGHPPTIDIPQVDAVVYALGVSLIESGLPGSEVGPQGNLRPGMYPHDLYPCLGEDAWCAIVVTSSAQWQALCDTIGAPEMGRDGRFVDAAARRRHADLVDRAVRAWTTGRRADEVMTTLQAAGVPAGAVLANDELCADPHLARRGFVAVVEQPGIGSLPVARLPLRRAGAERPELRPAPLLGEANAYAICEVLGHTPEELAAWIDDAVVH